MGAAMRIQQSSRQGCVVLSLAGRLDLAAAPQLQRAILKQLAQQPPAIICDLSQVEAIDPPCAGLLTSIRNTALSWPGTALILCGADPGVAEILLEQGEASRLAMYPSLDQALANANANANARPPWLHEQLTLGPVPTAAATGRAFVRKVCGRWGIQGLADPAALLASELVTLSVAHAGTVMELRVELVGARLQMAVTDQDPDLLGFLAAKEETDRRLSLLVVDQVATAWGVRQDEAGGKTAWCTLELPAQEADMAGSGRQLPVDSTATSTADDVEDDDRGGSQALGLPGSGLVASKLVVPSPRAGLLPRAGLQSLLEVGLEGKLCLVEAPAGFGKTTLLSQWQAAAGGDRVAWVSLEEGDNDPTRFWVYVVEALRTVEPDVGKAALAALGSPSADLYRAVLPGLLNDLHAGGSPLFLVLDDYHLITNSTCHQTLTFFLDHLPVGVHVALSGRTDPPLPLARMRARGEMAEIRVADLQFTDEEAMALLNASMGLQLTAEDVARLAERTEGWAAGLVLAGLSLRGRQDSTAFIAAFHGDNRHVADYLAAEVIERQPEEIRTFLLRTSILERLSGPLCDAVLEAEGSAGLLGELERSNLFLMVLDDRREWYRYHHLFAQLLRLELAGREPALLATLHRRAAAWHRQAGNLDEAIGHASAAGEFAQAAALIAQHWLAYWRRGQRATVARWLDRLPDAAILADPPVAYVAAWIRGHSGASKQQTEDWLAVLERDGAEGSLPDGVSPEGRLPDGVNSLVFGANLARASLVFDDLGRSVAAGRRALELAGPKSLQFWWMAQSALGHALYLSGQAAETRPQLEELVGRVPAAAQPVAVVLALAVLSLLAGDQDDDDNAMALARRAAATADTQGLSAEPMCGIAYAALGRALARQGELAEAEVQLKLALAPVGIDSMLVPRAFALLLLAPVRRGRGDLAGARALVEQARELIERSADPGSLPALLEQTEQALAAAPRRRVEAAAPLTERELVVLRLLPSRLSTREISRELSVSVTTIRSQVQAIYRKLQASSRDEAVTRARELGLLPESRPPTRSLFTPEDSADP
jgi:LuxR family transcriptional regulator, maltose regulon positive regulatory protein